ncbi:MAG: hypothetical protein AAGA60_16250 [Cyanobacteria bacterium P01_E01_bin.42]
MQEKLQASLLGVDDYFSISWSEFLKNIQAFSILSLIISLPTTLLVFVIPLFADSADPSDLDNLSGLFLFYIIVTLVLSSLVGLSIPKIIERSICDRKLGAFAAIQKSFLQLFPFLIVSIFVSIVIGVGFILLIVPGVWLAVHMSYIVHAIALRGCGLNSLNYSYSLVRGRWWAVFGRNLLIFLYLLGLFLVGFFILGAIFFIIGIVGGIIGLLGVGIIAQLGSNLIGSLIGCYINTIYTILFLNLDYTRHPIHNSLPEV